MRSITKQLILVLMIIMAYLPMTVVYAVPDISIPEQNPVVSEMDMSNCHDEQSSNKCGQCADQYQCQSTASSGLALAPSSDRLGINQSVTVRYMTHDVSTKFQQPIPLFRPPISL
jgi:hypothetical protein